MGEAKRRSSKKLPPKSVKEGDKNSPYMISWLPITQKQASMFVAITTRGAWIGISTLIIFWIIIRFIGPLANWWKLGDVNQYIT